MNKHRRLMLAANLTGVLASVTLAWHVRAADADDAIKKVMKTYHKAPKGQDPVCKLAQDGKATPEQLKQLVAGYETMTKSKPPRGDEAGWKEKTTALLTAAKALEKGTPGAAAKYKEAVNCKACHSLYKPEN